MEKKAVQSKFRRFKTFSIRRTLYGLALFIALLMITLAIVSGVQLKRLVQNSEEFSESTSFFVHLSRVVEKSPVPVQILRQAVEYSNPSTRPAYKVRYDDLVHELSTLKDKTSSKKHHEIIADTKRFYEQAHRVTQRIYQYLLEGETDKAVDEVYIAEEFFFDGISNLKSVNMTTSRELEKRLEGIGEQVQNPLRVMIASGLITVLLIFILSVYVAKRVTEPILQLRNAAQEVASGNYKLHMKISAEDEIGDLNRTFDMMIGEINKLITEKDRAFNQLLGAKDLREKDATELVKLNNELVAEIKERKNAEQELTKYQHQLEEKVDERTSELKKINEQLTQEIGERKHTEEKLASSLEEKEILLKEIHHRIKNNLQIITSLLFLQSDSATDAKIRTMFTESQNRIKSMALIHEKLYQSPDLAKVDFAGYIRNLTDHLFRSYNGNNGSVKLEMNVKDIFLNIDSAIPCGLLINELVSNSLKYAFPEGREGSIAIDFFAQNNGENILIVKDTGVGLPQDFDLKKTHTLGLQLVNSLSRQLKGTMELGSNGGTEFKFAFSGLESKPENKKSS